MKCCPRCIYFDHPVKGSGTWCSNEACPCHITEPAARQLAGEKPFETSCCIKCEAKGKRGSALYLKCMHPYCLCHTPATTRVKWGTNATGPVPASEHKPYLKCDNNPCVCRKLILDAAKEANEVQRKTASEWEETLESEIKMMCQFYFHMEMAQTASRANEQRVLWLKGVDRIKYLIRTELERARGEGERSAMFKSAPLDIEKKAFEKGVEIERARVEKAIKGRLQWLSFETMRTASLLPKKWTWADVEINQTNGTLKKD